MILKLAYEDVQSSGVRGEVNGKIVNFFMMVEINESNAVEAIQKLEASKGVVAFHYTGELSYLRTIEFGSKPVIVTKNVEKLDMNVDFMMGEIDSRVRVVFTLPKENHDMKAVYDFSRKYPNLKVEGGKFLRLDHCSIGGIGREDIPKKVADSRIALITEGEGSVFPTINIDDVQAVEFYELKATGKDKKPKVKTAEKPKKAQKTKTNFKPKKQLSSLLSLTGSGELDNF